MSEKIIEGIICKGWKNFLKRDNYNGFCDFLNKVFIEKNIKFHIEKKLFGRTKMREVTIITINNKLYILPNLELIKKEKEDICNENPKYIFYLNGKYLPRGIPNGEIEDLYLNYKKTLNFDHYYILLDLLYREDSFSIVLEKSIKRDDNFKEYYNLIDESIRLYFKKQFSGAISILLPCIEGILRKITNNYLGADNFYRKKYYLEKAEEEVLKKWSNIIYPKNEVWFHPELEKDYKYLYLFDEVPIIVSGFFKYLDAFFYRDIDDFRRDYPKENLNRHSIVHGYTLDYGKKENYLLLFGMLDFLLLLSKFELTRSRHNYESYIKMIEYININKLDYPINFKLNNRKILTDSLEFIKSIIRESMDDLDKELSKEIWRKRDSKEIFKNILSKKINKLMFIPFFVYMLVYDYEKENILLKYGSSGIYSSGDELELSIFEISFIEEFEKRNSYIYFYINFETKEVKTFFDNNLSII